MKRSQKKTQKDCAQGITGKMRKPMFDEVLRLRKAGERETKLRLEETVHEAETEKSASVWIKTLLDVLIRSMENTI